MRAIENTKLAEAVFDEDLKTDQPSPEEILAQCEQLAIMVVHNIRALTREGRCDPDQLARSLDKIDFALGQAFRDLHSD